MKVVRCDRCQLTYTIRGDGPYACPYCGGVGHSLLPIGGRNGIKDEGRQDKTDGKVQR